MSTYLRYQCEAHNPPLPALDEAGQHYYDLPRMLDDLKHLPKLLGAYESGELHRLYKAESDEVSNWFWEQWNIRQRGGEPPNPRGKGLSLIWYFRWNSIRFLEQHRDCPLSIVTEYGETIPLDPKLWEEQTRKAARFENWEPDYGQW